MSKWKHTKTGGDYIVLHHAKMQSNDWVDSKHDAASVDMEDVVIYKSLQDGMVWVRPKDEFYERFEEVKG